MTRSCQGCTKCCEGYLAGEAHGRTFYTGKPCHFVQIGRGCAIYKDRPADPCKTYQCSWRESDTLPEWMKPSEIDAIVDERVTPGGHRYISVHEAGRQLDSRVLSWLIQFALTNNANLRWEIAGGKNWLGSTEFCTEMAAA